MVPGCRAISQHGLLAIVILSGLMTSTLLNMVVVPTMYLRYARPSVPTRNEGE